MGWVKPLSESCKGIRLITFQIENLYDLLVTPPAFIGGARLCGGGFSLFATKEQNPLGIEIPPHDCHIPDGLPISVQHKPQGNVLSNRTGNFVYSEKFVSLFEQHTTGQRSEVFFRGNRVQNYFRFVPDASQPVLTPELLTNPVMCPVCRERTVFDCGIPVGTRLSPYAVVRDIIGLEHRQFSYPIYLGPELARVIEREYCMSELSREKRQQNRTFILEPLIDEASDVGRELIYYYKLFDNLRNDLNKRHGTLHGAPETPS